MYGQFFLLFALILVGYYCNKRGWLTRETNKSMSGMVMHVMIPAMLITTISSIQIDEKILKGFLLMAAAQLAGMLLFGLLARRYARFRKVDSRLYPMLDVTLGSLNTGFIGLPVTQIFFGSEGVLFMSAGVFGLHMYLWSYGVCSIESRGLGGLSGIGKTLKKVMQNPNCISILIGMVLALTHTTPLVPEVLYGFLQKVGDLATPLSLIYIGALAGSNGLAALLQQKQALEFALLKVVGMPLLAVAVLFFAPAGTMAKSVFLLSMAMPSAVIVPMIVEQYGYGEKLSSDIVLWTTFISMLTMPVCVWLAGILY